MQSHDKNKTQRRITESERGRKSAAIGKEELGTLIKQQRAARGMTQDDLASKFGVHRATIIRLENGYYKRLNHELYGRIAAWAGIGNRDGLNLRSYDFADLLREYFKSQGILTDEQKSEELIRALEAFYLLFIRHAKKED